MTAGSGFHGVLADWPEAASEGIRRAIAFETVPLRDRPEDIVYALFHRIWRREAPVTHLTADLVNQLQSRAWPGNFREVHAATDDMLIGRPGPVLREGAPAELHAETEVGPLKLGPLEESERRVILRYLRRNRFNKSATKRELGITINTLNAKIVKYAIAVPGRG
jgi:DNA-binding NtrC family response regulator